MTLEHGDRLFFDVSTTGMTLQFISRRNLEAAGNPGADRLVTTLADADTVTLTGAEVARLLEALDAPHLVECVVVDRGRTDTAWLFVSRVTKHGATLFMSDRNEIGLTAPERDMLAAAIRSRVWRLFQ